VLPIRGKLAVATGQLMPAPAVRWEVVVAFWSSHFHKRNE
jgi:hypothetical protein